MGSSRDVPVAISVRRRAILPLQLHVFNCVKFKDMIAFLCTSVLLLEWFREPGTSASPPINRKFVKDCLGSVEVASNVWLHAHRLVTKFQPSARRQVCDPPAWTRSKRCHRCAAAAVGGFARFTCGNNRLVSPSWALFFVKAPIRSLCASDISRNVCSIWMVFTLAPTWVSVLRTAACIRQVHEVPMEAHNMTERS